MQTAIALTLLCGVPPLLLFLGYLLRSKVRVRTAAAHRLPDLAGAPESPLARLLGAHGRATFRPRTEPGEHGDSHFGGRPWLPKGADWPTCGVCSRPMQLLLQLDLDDLPAGAPPQRSGGFAQVFYCTDPNSRCALEAAAEAPCGSAQAARVVDSRQLGARAPSDLAATAGGAAPLAPETIVAWEQGVDLPGRQACRSLALDDADAAAELAEQHGLPHHGDKLGGWPLLGSGGDLPRCPRCNEPMEFVFQLDATRHAKGAFGGSSAGQLSRCRTHSTTLAFAGVPGKRHRPA